MARFTISILTHSAVALSKRCVESVIRHSADYDLILTANGNVDAANHFTDVARGRDNVTVVVNEKNQGFVAPNRHALSLADSEYFIMINDDLTVVPSWLDKLMEPFHKFPDAVLSGPEGNGCHILPNFHGTTGVFEYLEGSCLCCKVSVVRAMGLFPPQLSGAYGEDSCLSLRVREAGHSIHRVKLPMPHVRGATSSQVPLARQWQEANHAWLKKRFAHYLRVRYFEHPIFLRRRDAWGDVLLVTPIIRALRKWRPLSPIYVETNCTDVFRDNPHVTKYGRGLPVPKDALVIDLNMAYERMENIHIVDAYAKATLEVLGGDFEVTDRSLDFYCRPSDAPKLLFAPGAKVVAVHAGPVSWRSKEWGAEKFQVVTKELLARGWTVVLVGATRTAPIACSVDLRGATTVHQMAAVIGAANLFIGLDSFPLHVAQAMGTPAVGIFGVTLSHFILTATNAAQGQSAIGLDSKAPTAGLRHRTLNSKEVDDAGAAISDIKPADVLTAMEFV